VPNFTARNHLNSAGVKFFRRGMSRRRFIKIMQRAGFDAESMDAGLRGFDLAREHWQWKMMGWVRG
jgi:hypothetical protein